MRACLPSIASFVSLTHSVRLVSLPHSRRYIPSSVLSCSYRWSPCRSSLSSRSIVSSLRLVMPSRLCRLVVLSPYLLCLVLAMSSRSISSRCCRLAWASRIPFRLICSWFSSLAFLRGVFPGVAYRLVSLAHPRLVSSLRISSLLPIAIRLCPYPPHPTLSPPALAVRHSAPHRRLFVSRMKTPPAPGSITNEKPAGNRADKNGACGDGGGPITRPPHNERDAPTRRGR